MPLKSSIVMGIHLLLRKLAEIYIELKQDFMYNRIDSENSPALFVLERKFLNQHLFARESDILLCVSPFCKGALREDRMPTWLAGSNRLATRLSGGFFISP